jgi:hypothetical protein
MILSIFILVFSDHPALIAVDFCSCGFQNIGGAFEEIPSACDLQSDGELSCKGT